MKRLRRACPHGGVQSQVKGHNLRLREGEGIGCSHADAGKEAPGFAFVVRSMTLDFLRPARMHDVLEIVTEPEAVKGASIILHQRVMRGDEILVEASVRVAFVSGGRARSIPNSLRIAMGAVYR
jgi:acyl-CoA thioester hydrolase